MTDENGRQSPMGKVILGRMLAKLTDWIILGVLAFAAVNVIGPVGEKASAIWHLPDAMMEVSERVRIMSQPADVFEISQTNTRPIDGYCVEREPCEIRVRLRRISTAADCRLVPGSVQWGFVNPRADAFIGAKRLDTPAGRNIGTTWEYTDVTLLTPPGLMPDADFVFEASYTNCPGMIPGDEPIVRRSKRVPFEIRS